MMPRTKPVQIKPQANQEIGWSEIAGVDEAKAELKEVVEFLRDPTPFSRLGATVPRGVLLHGPPGTGKTLLAKAVAHESGAQFFSQSASSFVEMFAGLGAARIRRLFAEARKHAPAILFIDELDAVGARRGTDNNSEREQTLNQLLVEMDGFSGSSNIVVMAASNLLEKLDPALLRPGRFDRQVFVSPPDVAGRRKILDVHTRGKPLREDANLDMVAAQTSGLTGADLANICNEAAIFCARRDGHAISKQDFDDALERVIAGVLSSTTLNPHERRVVAYHEAGHALCRELLETTERVHKISIVPRGSALGYVMNLPDEDSYLKTREELVDQMTVLLGGRVAEQMIFGAVTTGAANDLQRVAEITHAMVHEYGMGTSTPTARAVTDANIVSDLTRRIRDEEQQELAFEAEHAAQRLINGHRAKLEEFAQALLDREVLERQEIDEIMRDVPKLGRLPGEPGLRVVATSREDRPGPAPR
jgi:cell division protease FtsH